VVLVSGPTALTPPAGVELLSVRSAEQMARAVEARAPEASVVVMAAAVSDYRPAAPARHKLKKRAGGTTLELVRTPDILLGLGARKAGRFLIGFAAETQALVENARAKLLQKNLDLIVANEVGREGSGFGSETNAALLLDRAGGKLEVPLVSKRELAERVWDRVSELRGRGQGSAGARTRRAGSAERRATARKRGRSGMRG
jgi:phosphopantothenoylcysteine decarboxylase/phosphopantothenate--cysteine ligase